MTPCASSSRETPPRSGQRLAGLDGLRGLAALVVVIFHCVLVSPTLGRIYRGEESADGALWWFTHTPAHIVWAGTEAVTIFFVLSGFVLALPFLHRTDSRRWRKYYPQRLLRLYLPVAASIAFASGTYLLVDHTANPGMSWWMEGHDIPNDLSAAAHDMALVFGSGWLNSVLWSLRWEVLFSLVLPFVILALTNRWLIRFRPIAGLLVVVAIGVCGQLEVTSIGYMLTFVLGAILAAETERLRRKFATLDGTRWLGLMIVAVTLILSSWWPGVQLYVAPGLIAIGAALLIAAFMWCPVIEQFGHSKLLGWLGGRSFSLYLTHEPVVVTVALILDTTNPVLVMLTAIPTSFGITEVFFRLVENPSHRISRRVGRFAGGSSQAETSKAS